MIVDAHQHFWKYNAARHAWLTDDMAAIRKDFLPEQLADIYTVHGIDACVAVQVDQDESENDFFLDFARKHSFIRGIVGWVNLRGSNIQQRLEYYSHDRLVKGFRHIVQGETDPQFLLNKDFGQGIALLARYGFTYDILVYAHQLAQVEQFVNKFPDQPFIIDHLAKPDIKNKELAQWARYMKSIARHENVYCKVSGMVTEANWQKWTYNDLKPYLDVVLEAFGPSRLVYGSDWPVCLVAASYEQQLSVVQQFIKGLSPDEQQKILGDNATRFYHL